ncbi:MAG: hypothetical protein K0Q90_61 [Paenibacillaceae bacterium]|jgi:hypothetical protein|nr:hypothetical protein [Paenibacillaceae bacterium]
MSEEKKKRRSIDWWDTLPEIISELFPSLFRGMLRLIRSLFD